MTINLSNNYEDFISQFEIYSSYQKAKYVKPVKNGFEIHHITPIGSQQGFSRKEPQDDRCVILTTFEHILAHYLYCKEHPEDTSQFNAFNCLVNFRGQKLLADEKKFIEELPHLAEIRKKRVYKGHPAWNKGIPCTDETKSKISETLRSRKLSSQNRGVPCPKERKRRISETLRSRKLSSWNKGVLFSEESKKRMSESHRKPIYLFDKEGVLVDIFKDRAEASTALGVCTAMVTKLAQRSSLFRNRLILSHTNYIDKTNNTEKEL